MATVSDFYVAWLFNGHTQKETHSPAPWKRRHRCCCRCHRCRRRYIEIQLVTLMILCGASLIMKVFIVFVITLAILLLLHV